MEYNEFAWYIDLCRVNVHEKLLPAFDIMAEHFKAQAKDIDQPEDYEYFAKKFWDFWLMPINNND